MSGHQLQCITTENNCFPRCLSRIISLSFRLQSVNHLFIIDYFSGDCQIGFALNFSRWHHSSQFASLAFKGHITVYNLSQRAERCLNRSFLVPTATWRIHYCGYDVEDVLTQQDTCLPHTSMKNCTHLTSQLRLTLNRHSAETIILVFYFVLSINFLI